MKERTEMTYANHIAHKTTPQTQPLFGRTDQVKNSAGGFVFGISPMQQLTRFLVLGSEGGTYYATEKDLTVTNANNILKLVENCGREAVQEIVAISSSQPARAPKNAPSVFALAIAAALGSDETKTAAFDALPLVCRIPTDLFSFIEQYQALGGGWGRRMKRAIAGWYQGKSAKDLAYTVSKYQNRNGWSHRDVLRLGHIHPRTPEENEIFSWMVKGTLIGEVDSEATGYLEVADGALKGLMTEKELIGMIHSFNLPREVLNTKYLNSVPVWEALLEKMPVTAMIRNLPKMTSIGLIKPLSKALETVQKKLNQEALVKGRVHPLTMLVAGRTYASGRGVKGNLSWTPVPQLVGALDQAFYDCFGAVEPTNKRTMICLDVSGSMTWGNIAGLTGLTPRVASAAMAMVAARTEPKHYVMGFQSRFVELPFVNKSNSLTTICNSMNNLPFGGTDCSIPMEYATKNNLEVDLFQVYTDNETYAGRQHPSVALKEYRQKSGINAKLVVCGMTATNFTIADPKDPGMLDVVGADTSLPNIIREFSQW